jgi:hypothetical protein
LAFSSNRNNGGGRDTNLFIAEWQDWILEHLPSIG